MAMLYNLISLNHGSERTSGPGPQTFMKGNELYGFYGEVTSSQFISGDTLSTAIGLTVGSSHNSTVPWLKFCLDGKILFVPRMTIRRNISWQDVYQRGAVYGDDTNGKSPSGTVVKQNARVSIFGDTFKVRLLVGSATDPNTANSNINSEWDRLIFPISNRATPTQPTPKWNLYSEAELGVVPSADGNYSWCKEVVGGGPASRILRGSGITSTLYQGLATTRHMTFGWRPCLELIS